MPGPRESPLRHRWLSLRPRGRRLLLASLLAGGLIFASQLPPIGRSAATSTGEPPQPQRTFAALLTLDAVLLAGLFGWADRQRREQRRLRRALHRRENLDELTGLLNRQGLLAAMERQRQESPQAARALLLLDIRHFSLINTSYGRAFGDRVLVGLARWLERRVPGPAILARTGGDEFSCALAAGSAVAVREEIRRISEELQQLDLPVDGRTLHLSVSAGARLLAGFSPEQALHEAGVARDLGRRSGRGPCPFYGDEPIAMRSTLAIQRLNQELITALQEQRIDLFAQAAWRIRDPHLPAVYLELLARVREPGSGGHRWSEELVEAASHCGTMPRLDARVLDLGFHSLAGLLASPAGDPAIGRMVYAFNVTADTLLAEDFVPSVERRLEREALDPARLCFEITEQAAARDPEGVRRVMQRLRRLGLRFALDDFGAGMTCLSQLRDLPLDYVKIDKIFVAGLRENAVSRLTVEFVVRMGREQGFETIAEGVEDFSQLRALRDLGVDIAQGFATAVPSRFDPLEDAGFARSGLERPASSLRRRL